MRKRPKQTSGKAEQLGQALVAASAHREPLGGSAWPKALPGRGKEGCKRVCALKCAMHTCTSQKRRENRWTKGGGGVSATVSAAPDARAGLSLGAELVRRVRGKAGHAVVL